MDLFQSYLVLSNKTIINLNLIDTTYGNGECAALFYPYYKKANSIILIYDVTNRESFNECDFFSDRIKDLCGYTKRVLLLGNKAESNNERQISFDEGEKYADEREYSFMEVSCNEAKSIRKAMEIAIGLALTDDKIKKDISKNVRIKKDEYISLESKKKKNNCI